MSLWWMPNSLLVRCVVLTIPAVTVLLSDSGLPTAITHSPARRDDEDPNRSTGRPVCDYQQLRNHPITITEVQLLADPSAITNMNAIVQSRLQLLIHHGNYSRLFMRHVHLLTANLTRSDLDFTFRSLPLKY